MEDCAVPYCEDDFLARPICGDLSLGQADYRGTIDITVTGAGCDFWSKNKAAKENGHTATSMPWAGLTG